MTLLIYIPIFVIFPIIGIVLKTLLSTRWKINLFYDFDDFSKEKYEYLNNALFELSKSNKIWQINTSTLVLNKKYNAGAGENVTRCSTTLSEKVPFFIGHNIKMCLLNLRGEKMLFTPDRIIYFKGWTQVYGRNYKGMHINITSTNFIETEMVPKDATIIDHTWKYVNKDGSPDKRFNDNRRYPICKYGQLMFKTDDGINIHINFSNLSLSEKLNHFFIEFMKLENNQIKRNYVENEKNSQDGNEVLYDEIKKFVIDNQKVSVSILQRRFRLRYEDAAKLIDRLEKEKIIDSFNDNAQKDVLISNNTEAK